VGQDETAQSFKRIFPNTSSLSQMTTRGVNQRLSYFTTKYRDMPEYPASPCRDGRDVFLWPVLLIHAAIEGPGQLFVALRDPTVFIEHSGIYCLLF
jgi:hypothetical protein